MSGNEENFANSTGKLNAIALLQKHLLPWNSTFILSPAIHADIRKALHQLLVSAHMIAMMVSIENCHQLHVKFLQTLQYRLSFSGIYNRCYLPRRVMQQKDVVVRKYRKSVNLHLPLPL
jgi:hypothetical protein